MVTDNISSRSSHPVSQTQTTPNQPAVNQQARRFAANNIPAAPRQQPTGFFQNIRSLFGRGEAAQPAPARTHMPAHTQALHVRASLNQALQSILSGQQDGAQQLGLVEQAFNSLPTGANLPLSQLVDSALSCVPSKQWPALVSQLETLRDNATVPNLLAETLINEATERAHSAVKQARSQSDQATLNQLSNILQNTPNPALNPAARDQVGGKIQTLFANAFKERVALVQLNALPASGNAMPGVSMAKHVESTSVSTVLQTLSAADLKTTLSCTGLHELARLASETSPQDPLHQTFKAELKARETKDLQSFQTIVGQLKADDLDLPHSLTDAPAFSDTVVQMAEVWLRLQAYAAVDANFTLSAQTLQDHSDMVNYLHTQTQADTLAADDLNDAQLGALNLALKKFIPKNQHATVLSGFQALFQQEFEGRIQEKANATIISWKSLMHIVDAPADALLMDLSHLAIARKATAECAAALLMDGGREATQEALDRALTEAFNALPAESKKLMLQRPWDEESTIETLLSSAQDPQLSISDEVRATLAHTIAELPGLARNMLYGQRANNATRIVLDSQPLSLYQNQLQTPLSTAESSSTTTCSLQDAAGTTVSIKISDAFIKDINRGFATLSLEGKTFFDQSNWSNLQQSAKDLLVQTGLQELFAACDYQPDLFIQTTRFLHQGIGAAETLAIGLATEPFVQTNCGRQVQAFESDQYRASFDLTRDDGNGFLVRYHNDYEVSSIVTSTGKNLTLVPPDNTLSITSFFSIHNAHNDLHLEAAPVFDFALQAQFSRPYPAPTTTATGGAPGLHSELLSASSMSNATLASDLQQFAQVHAGQSIGNANHPQATADGMVRAWNFFATHQGTPNLTELRYFRDMLLNPNSVTYSGLNTQIAQGLSADITQLEQKLVDAFEPIAMDCRLNLNGAFALGQGHFSGHQWSFGNFTGTYSQFLTQASPDDLHNFRQWAMSPMGCPESLAFMDALTELKHHPDEALAHTMLQTFTLAPSNGSSFGSGSQAPAGTYYLNVGGPAYAKATAAVNAIGTDRQQVADAARTALQTAMDTTLLPAFMAYAPDL